MRKEEEMKRKLIVLVVLLSILCASTAKGWTVFHHRSMTRDALKGIAEELGLTDDDLKLIASAAVDVDLYLGDPENTCHRVTTYRDKFNELNKKRKEKSGERSCEWQGAEWWAKAFIRRAKEELENGNRSEALRNLGYAIHYIQDAVNPPHVFPFKLETLTGPHLSFEMYAYSRYLLLPEWQEKVRDAPEETPILGPEDLSIKLKEKADEVYNELRVKYIEEGDNNVCVSSQAALISSIKDCGAKGWEMPDEDIIRAMRIAAGLVKSAAKWVFLSKIYRDQYPNTIYQAPTVPPGTYSDHGGDPNDPRDCLAIQVSQGQKISLELTGPTGTDFDLRVYKPSNTSRASWESVKGNTSNERIVIDSAPETGRYVICIKFASGSGVWKLAIKVESGVSLPPPPSQPPATPTLPPPKPPLKGATTASALVMDVSGSMGWTWQGEVKLESAKRVASQTISLIEGEARASGAGHSLAIVSFSDQANLLLPLTTDYRRAKGVVLTLSPQASTNLGAGLQMALAELAKAPAGSQKYITLLSDGHITSGMSEGEVLAGPVAQARQRKICIHTVGFGNPDYLKEDFLKMISQQSGCGKYLYAKNAFELTNAYIKLRHLSLGGSIAEFVSQAKIYEGETLTLGVVSLPGPRAGQEIEELHFTLTWSGSRLQPRLFDPAGVEVTEGYPGAQITYFEQFAHVAVRQPQPGFWKVVIFGEEVPPQGSDFYAVLSTRPGKLATIIPVINPVICFKYPSGEERCRYLLQGNIPTWRIIIGNIATLAVLAVIVAVVIYLRLSGQIP
jgi:hypothetical protein